MNKTVSYKDSGVDIDKGNEFVARIGQAVRRTWGPEVVSSYGAFSGMFALNSNILPLFKRTLNEPVLVACTDGVGTKLKVANILNRHDTIGIDLVAMNVNDLIVSGATPLFFLDYLATGKLDPATLAAVVQGIADGCCEAGCSLIGGETAEMPDFYSEGDYDIAGFSVGIVEKDRIVDPAGISPGDTIIGLASSGLHSNGYSLARKVLIGRKKHPDRTICEQLLTPTRIYVKAVREVLACFSVKRVVRGMAHITGGGLYENIARILPANCRAVIDVSAWEAPPIYHHFRGSVADREMYRVFNMGIGYVFIIRPFYENTVMRALRRAGETAWKIGTVVKGKGDVKITGEKT